MDYIPEGLTLVEMTAAFLEEAEVEHHNAIVNLLPASEIAALQIRMDACAARHSLTKFLLEALRNEIKNPEGLIEIVSEDSGIEQHLTFESLTKWASMYGIGSLGWAYSDVDTEKTETFTKSFRWQDVTIKIYANDRVAYFSDKTGPKGKVASFQDIGLMGRRKKMPNELGLLLIGLSEKKKYPSGKKSANKHAAAISKLRSALRQLAGLPGEPFYFNEGDGYKPRFTLIDDRKNADNRAKVNAQHDVFDETKNYKSENDAADDWLVENDR